MPSNSGATTNDLTGDWTRIPLTGPSYPAGWIPPDEYFGYKPGTFWTEPKWKQWLDLGSIPAREVWKGIESTGRAMWDVGHAIAYPQPPRFYATSVPDSANLLQDPYLQRQATQAMLGIAGLGEGASTFMVPEEGPGAYVGMFFGRTSPAWSQQAEDTARAMETSGADPTEIYAQTGLFRPQMTGSPGLAPWRAEISDKGAELNPSFAPNAKAALEASRDDPATHGLYLPDVLSHDELFRIYPDLADTRVFGAPPGAGYKGMYNPITGDIHLDPNLSPDVMESSLLHEIQHKIQHREGWGAGGNPDMFLPSGFRQKYADAKREGDPWIQNMSQKGISPGRVYKAIEAQKRGHQPSYHDLPHLQAAQRAYHPSQLIDFHTKYGDLARLHGELEDAYQEYYGLHGEAESRRTQLRKELDMPARRKFAPWMESDPQILPHQPLTYVPWNEPSPWSIELPRDDSPAPMYSIRDGKRYELIPVSINPFTGEPWQK